MRRLHGRVLTGGAAVTVVIGLFAGVGSTANATAAPATEPANACQLANGIKHVVNIQFDNVHFTRDTPNVPSDLEQMPNLLNFLEANGTVLTNDHDVLVHTATNFLSQLTGLYEDRHSVTQSNSFSYYDAAGNTHPGVSFAYWTAPIFDPSGANADTSYNLNYQADPAANPSGTNVNVPAPWVPYTRAGCDVGNAGMANMVLENTGIDIPTVFGANSPEAAEVAANPVKAAADFVGIAVHCAAASSRCDSGRPDLLPDEPGGYQGYNALYGAAEVQPAIKPSGPITSLSGSVITDAAGNPGFPGFDSMTPDNSLGFAAQMLESGIPVVNAYVSDAHTDHVTNTGDFGPGEQGFEDQLHAYDTAFGAFMSRMAADGINAHNTLFMVTTDEGDHFSGTDPTPAGCTGAPGNYCTYAIRSEVNVNVKGLLVSQFGNNTGFAIHSDPAPAFWVNGNPAPDSDVARTLERQVGALTVANPLTGGTDQLGRFLADPVEEKILHFVGPDAARTPTFTAFSGDDEFVFSGAPNCTSPCVTTPGRFAWNHGTITPDQTTIWVGFAGPGIAVKGTDSTTFADQTDVRPTELALLGLRDDYQVDGRVLVEDLKAGAVPPLLHMPQVQVLGELYKQLEACEGQFALDTLAISTQGINSGSTGDDHVYAATEAQLTLLGNQRDALGAQIRTALLGAAFDNKPVTGAKADALIAQAKALLATAHTLATS